MRGCEYNDLVVFIQFLEDPLGERPDINPGHDLDSIGECHGDSHITVTVLVLIAVDQCLVKIEDKCFPALWFYTLDVSLFVPPGM